MNFYLLDHPQQIDQHRYPRRAKLSGMIGVHTAEGVMDDVGMDTGAENVASYIVQRSDYGSYHCIVDSDSVVRMAPDDHETWHIAADLHNWHSWGISAACRTVDWDLKQDWTQNTLRRMGAEICAFWGRNHFNVQELATNWLTINQARQHLPGLVEHGVVQPGDRTDAWATRPDRDNLRNALSNYILAAYHGTLPPVPLPTKPPTEDTDDMIPAPRKSWVSISGEIWAQRPDGTVHYINDENTFYLLRTPVEGHPPEILEPVKVSDGVMKGLVFFFNE